MNDFTSLGLGAAASLFFGAAVIQNALLVRALGLSALFSPNAFDRKPVYCLQLAAASVGTSLLYSVFSGRLLSHLGFSEYIRPLGVAVCACVMYAVIMPLSKVVASKERKQEAVRCAASACFNIPVFACALITAANHYSLLTTALYALGLCAGFLIGAMLVAAARRRLNADSVPAPFRGLPATLLCLAGMALSLQSLSAA